PPLGKSPEQLDEKERDRLGELKEEQRAVQDRMEKLLRQMEQVRDKRREEKDNDTAKQLDQALQKANEGNITGRMQEAQGEIKKNQTQKAAENQREAIDQLKNVVKELEDRRAANLDRLAKK